MITFIIMVAIIIVAINMVVIIMDVMMKIREEEAEQTAIRLLGTLRMLK